MSACTKTFTITGGTTPSVTETSDHGSLQQNSSQAGTYTVGGDTIVLSSGNAVTVTLGAGTSQLETLGASSIKLMGGSGPSTITSDLGNNTFIAGSSTLNITGGGGKGCLS